MTGKTYSQLETIVDGLITGAAKPLELFVWANAGTVDYPLRMAIDILRSFHDYPYFKVDMRAGRLSVGHGPKCRDLLIVATSADPKPHVAGRRLDTFNLTFDHAFDRGSARPCDVNRWLDAEHCISTRRIAS